MGRKPKEDNNNLEGLNKSLAEIEKKFGKGVVVNLGKEYRADVDVIPTGLFSLDLALGVGGLPRGRVIEIYGNEASGKTSLALSIIAQAQKQGRVVSYIDAEHAFDDDYAKNKIGVDIEKLVFIKPDCGEDALNIVETLIDSNNVDVIVIDSVASLVPKAEVEGEMGDSHMGLQARLMSQALRKLTSKVSKTNTCLIFINQTRMKIGVFFGCVHGETIVLTDEGGVPIEKIVENKLKVKIYSYNEKEDKFELNPILDYHINGKINKPKDYIYIESEGIETKNGKNGITVTPDHLLLTNFGYKKAKDLEIGDLLITKYEEKINNNTLDFINGMIIGDSYIDIRTKNTASIKIQDNQNKEYLKWKLNKLKKVLYFKKNGKRYESEFRYELKLLKDNILYERNPIPILIENYSPLTLAIWFMDDAHLDLRKGHCRYRLSMKRFKNNQLILGTITRIFQTRNFNCNYHLKSGEIRFTKSGTLKIADIIKKYIPTNMQYKLPSKYRNQYKEFNLKNEFIIKSTFSKITRIRSASKRQMRNKKKYDLTIANNYNYLVGNLDNGVVIHNSPETTPGGKALKFYSSIRIELRRGKKITKGQEVVGTMVKAKVVKNKVAPPFRNADLKILNDEGFSVASDILDLGIVHGIIKEEKKTFSFEKEKLGRGWDNSRQFIKDNPKVAEAIKKQLLNLLGKHEEEKT